MKDVYLPDSFSGHATIFSASGSVHRNCLVNLSPARLGFILAVLSCLVYLFDPPQPTLVQGGVPALHPEKLKTLQTPQLLNC